MCRSHVRPKTLYNSPTICYHRLNRGDVAQLGERDNRTVEVRGSSPLISTKGRTIYFTSCKSQFSMVLLLYYKERGAGVVGLLFSESSRVVRGYDVRLNSPVSYKCESVMVVITYC